ncbi:hypothetical protein CD30_07340 [Ureibacillus massiliensis 4400831 = CIP 108448 = CCUG 49529]|uniref:Prepilin-type N-terminal cleavage/methylation domain-containing protein n=1 Tax=Ureibacillus massiliensis 4400831 = CIP 108448 = CCUG 49529 TaxID=1211035 RepID=A0A0A3J6B6_9BACL|nr:prepilin-type N-terminal cleavage/methylation domain-containing protein [Ureibacillus massiliensis]KGR91245.1 hypothetical protein CD30_07340 [Ureibacillus massiliensis 4400831 = CIP 108448 = CCUG 49529]
MKLSNMNNESGISLIEVVASVVILTIILLGFFGMFLQSAKTTQTSEEIVDATYIAQKNMEELYLQTKNGVYSINNYEDAISNLGYTKIDDYYTKTIDSKNYIKLTVQTPVNGYNHLTRVVIYVIEVNESKEVIKAQMENTLQWRE